MQPPGVWAPVSCHWLNELLRLSPALLLPIIAVPRNTTMGHWLQLIHKGTPWVTQCRWYPLQISDFRICFFPDVVLLILNMKSSVEWWAPMIDPSIIPETVSPCRSQFVLFEGSCLIEQVSLKKKLYNCFWLLVCALLFPQDHRTVRSISLINIAGTINALYTETLVNEPSDSPWSKWLVCRNPPTACRRKRGTRWHSSARNDLF